MNRKMRKTRPNKDSTATMPIPSGPEIKAVRIARGISALELSKRAKVSRQAIIDWESGKRTPRFPTVRKVMECLHKIPTLPDFGLGQDDKPKE